MFVTHWPDLPLFFSHLSRPLFGLLLTFCIALFPFFSSHYACAYRASRDGSRRRVKSLSRLKIKPLFSSFFFLAIFEDRPNERRPRARTTHSARLRYVLEAVVVVQWTILVGGDDGLPLCLAFHFTSSRLSFLFFFPQMCMHCNDCIQLL